MRKLIGPALAILVAALFIVVPARGQSAQGDPFSVGLQPVVTSGLTSPVTLASSPDSTGRLFIVDQVGLIKILMPDGTVLPQPFLDLRSSIIALNPNYDERGLLGLAFHPHYAANGRFFVYYNRPLR